MKIYRFSLLLLLPLLGMKKCERDVAPTFTLPPTTQTGANTIGFVVDGRVWRNHGWLPYTAAESDNIRNSYVSFARFDLSAGQIDRNRYESFHLYLDSLVSVGTYEVNTNVVPGATRRAERVLIFSDESEKNTTVIRRKAQRQLLPSLKLIQLNTLLQAHLTAYWRKAQTQLNRYASPMVGLMSSIGNAASYNCSNGTS